MAGEDRPLQLRPNGVLYAYDAWEWVVSAPQHLDEVLAQLVFDTSMLVTRGAKGTQRRGQVLGDWWRSVFVHPLTVSLITRTREIFGLLGKDHPFADTRSDCLCAETTR